MDMYLPAECSKHYFAMNTEDLAKGPVKWAARHLIDWMGFRSILRQAVTKSQMTVALGSLAWWLMTLHLAGGLKPDDHCGPFPPRPLCESMSIANGMYKNLRGSFKAEISVSGRLYGENGNVNDNGINQRWKNFWDPTFSVHPFNSS